MTNTYTDQQLLTEFHVKDARDALDKITSMMRLWRYSNVSHGTRKSELEILRRHRKRLFSLVNLVINNRHTTSTLTDIDRAVEEVNNLNHFL